MLKNSSFADMICLIIPPFCPTTHLPKGCHISHFAHFSLDLFFLRASTEWGMLRVVTCHKGSARVRWGGVRKFMIIPVRFPACGRPPPRGGARVGGDGPSQGHGTHCKLIRHPDPCLKSPHLHSNNLICTPTKRYAFSVAAGARPQLARPVAFRRRQCLPRIRPWCAPSPHSLHLYRTQTHARSSAGQAPKPQRIVIRRSIGIHWYPLVRHLQDKCASQNT